MALRNSSFDAAQPAIEKFGLHASKVKAYGSAEDLAADPDVKLILCSMRVDKHCETIIPSIQAGKSVHIELPFAENLERIEKLVSAYRARKNKNQVAVVDLQGRFAPPVVKIKELLQT